MEKKTIECNKTTNKRLVRDLHEWFNNQDTCTYHSRYDQLYGTSTAYFKQSSWLPKTSTYTTISQILTSMVVKKIINMGIWVLVKGWSNCYPSIFVCLLNTFLNMMKIHADFLGGKSPRKELDLFAVAIPCWQRLNTAKNNLRGHPILKKFLNGTFTHVGNLYNF